MSGAGGWLVRYGILIIVVLISVAPILWLAMSSLKTNKEILDSALSLPSSPSLAGYFEAITRGNYPLYFMNSLITAGGAVALSLTIFGLAAYVLARFSFPGRTVIYSILVSSLLISLIPMIQPISYVVRSLGLYDTHLALILVFTAKGLPITLFVLHSYFRSLPPEIEEAAVIDGANLWRLYWSVAVPMARPAFASAAVLVFLDSWNDFLFPLILTQSQGNRVLALGTQFFIQAFAYDYPTLLSAVVLTIIPSVVVYVLLQGQIQKSLAAGAVKG